MEDADLIEGTATRNPAGPRMDTGEGAGTDMTSYFDYLRQYAWTGPASFVHAGFNSLYDQSHGSTRYWMSKTPILGQMRKWNDEAQYWEDTYNNTGKDPAYSTAFGGSNPAASVAGMAGAAAGAVKMARSLVTMYQPEVVEDVGYNPNRPEFG